MNNWNQLLYLLDKTLGFPNKIRSAVKKTSQAFDQRAGEHVFVLEYRIKVNPGAQPNTKRLPGHTAQEPDRPLGMIRRLMTGT